MHAEQHAHKQKGKVVWLTTRRSKELRQMYQLEELCEDRLREIKKLQSEAVEIRRSRTKLLDQLTDARITSTRYRGPAIPVILGVDIQPDAHDVDNATPPD